MSIHRLFSYPLLILGASALMVGQEPSAAEKNTPPPPIGKGEKKQKASKLRTVEGVVRDDHDRPVQGAIVELRELETNKARSDATQTDGSYRFSDVRKDMAYEVKATRTGFAPALRKVSKYDTRPTAIINLTLEANPPK